MKRSARFHRMSTLWRAPIHLATATLALVMVAEPPAVPRSATGVGLQVARTATQSYRSHWRDDSDDKGADVDKPITGPTKSGRTGGFKSGASGYNPERVQRFWSHYHGARPGPKEKPLERQTRDTK